MFQPLIRPLAFAIQVTLTYCFLPNKLLRRPDGSSGWGTDLESIRGPNCLRMFGSRKKKKSVPRLSGSLES